MDELWSNTLKAVKKEVAPQVFEAWIRPLRPAGPIRDDQLELLVINDFSREWVESHYDSLLQSSVSEVAGRTVEITYTVDTESTPPPVEKGAKGAKGEGSTGKSGAPGQDHKGTSRDKARSGESTQGENKSREGEAKRRQMTGLDPRYTFDSLVVGNCNQFVHAVAARVAEAPAQAYNPLFIHGGVGLGKTHMIQAIGNQALKHHPGKRVLYLSSEKFMIELINSLRFKRSINFKENFRSVDILMVDDIQFIAGKRSTQEEFFHTFNALYGENKQIILTSDTLPSEIEHLEERLSSRFGMGLVADIGPPDLETRVAILKKKASQEGLELADEVAFFLAEAIDSNVRELEGALVRVTAFASMNREPITLSMVRDQLRGTIRSPKKEITIEGVQRIICDAYGITIAEICSKKRSRRYALPRQVAMYLGKQLTDHSYPEIGKLFGGRDHTTVLYAVRQIEKRRKNDSDLDEKLNDLTERIKR